MFLTTGLATVSQTGHNRLKLTEQFRQFTQPLREKFNSWLWTWDLRVLMWLQEEFTTVISSFRRHGLAMIVGRPSALQTTCTTEGFSYMLSQMLGSIPFPWSSSANRQSALAQTIVQALLPSDPICLFKHQSGVQQEEFELMSNSAVSIILERDLPGAYKTAPCPMNPESILLLVVLDASLHEVPCPILNSHVQEPPVSPKDALCINSLRRKLRPPCDHGP